MAAQRAPGEAGELQFGGQEERRLHAGRSSGAFAWAAVCRTQAPRLCAPTKPRAIRTTIARDEPQVTITV